MRTRALQSAIFHTLAVRGEAYFAPADGSVSSIRHVVHLRSNEPIAATDIVVDINSSPTPL
ncbi:hypothetical protein OUZ56_001824 [Daphnia magna]|uniref:Uncharacterized protein n=1 Tax=Daphnia magna TaxID=35525 RepID=A0ABR0A3U4_9CRUS|nr:hypothetical protein OUZ56_001824 [Daphnia magna]